jgi:hypothetical protein
MLCISYVSFSAPLDFRSTMSLLAIATGFIKFKPLFGEIKSFTPTLEYMPLHRVYTVEEKREESNYKITKHEREI